jgi:hypothetical protein
MQTLATRDSCRLDHEPHPEFLLVSCIPDHSLTVTFLTGGRCDVCRYTGLLNYRMAVTFMAVFWAWFIYLPVSDRSVSTGPCIFGLPL